MLMHHLRILTCEWYARRNPQSASAAGWCRSPLNPLITSVVHINTLAAYSRQNPQLTNPNCFCQHRCPFLFIYLCRVLPLSLILHFEALLYAQSPASSMWEIITGFWLAQCIWVACWRQKFKTYQNANMPPLTSGKKCGTLQSTFKESQKGRGERVWACRGLWY